MPGSRFTISFNYKTTNADRLEMFELYQRAFGATKTYQSVPPNSDEIHIMMDIHGSGILLGPGNAEARGFDDPIVCEMRFDDRADFDKAYEVLSKEGRSSVLEGPYPWATRLGLVTDKFGVGWALYFNEPRWDED